ncbi:TPA: hypothetical protein RQK48_004233 [Vibrio vulnificus]|nr:hypothetical protein [Vibrio vulnificus]
MQYKMSPEEYFKQLINLYQEARNPRFYNPNILRGRSKSVSSDMEDLTALFLALNLSRHAMFYTDQPVKFTGQRQSKYPDILIHESSGQIKHLVDTKTDMGWNRNGVLPFCKEWDALIESVKGTETEFKTGKDGQIVQGVFSTDLKYHVVVASEVNSGRQILEDYERVKSECQNVNLYLLSKGCHPNSYKYSPQGILENIEVNHSDFERLVQTIEQA